MTDLNNAILRLLSVKGMPLKHLHGLLKKETVGKSLTMAQLLVELNKMQATDGTLLFAGTSDNWYLTGKGGALAVGGVKSKEPVMPKEIPSMTEQDPEEMAEYEELKAQVLRLAKAVAGCRRDLDKKVSKAEFKIFKNKVVDSAREINDRLKDLEKASPPQLIMDDELDDRVRFLELLFGQGVDKKFLVASQTPINRWRHYLADWLEVLVRKVRGVEG